MGLIPTDADLPVENPDFTGSLHWNYANGFSWGPNFARFKGPQAAQPNVNQINIPTIAGTTYFVGFSIVYQNFISPGNGIQVDLSGDTDGQRYAGVDSHVARIISTQNGSTLNFDYKVPVDGVELHLDKIAIATTLSYVIHILGFNWPDDRKTEFWHRAGNRVNQILASRNGNTNCLIAFDL